MIFQRSLQRELVSTAGAVFTAIFTIIITFMLIKILGQAAGGKVASTDVIALIGFAALNHMPILLILTGFISVLMVVTRCYQDSEMVVWFASGQSLVRWIRPVLGFGMPLVVLTAVLSLVVTPWANRQSDEFKERFEKREDIAKVAPGKFQESSSSDRIFFVEGISGDVTKVQNVFVSGTEGGRTSVIVAKEGMIETRPNGDKMLVMQKGRRYDGVATQADFQLMEFERYTVRIASKGPQLENDQSSKARSTQELIRLPTIYNLGELMWRISLPVMALLLMLLAIPLGFVNPRAGRSANLIFALLLYVTYSSLVSALQSSVIQNRIKFSLAWWPLHLVFALLIAFLFAWYVNVNSAWHPKVLWGRVKRCIWKIS
ncbi:MAG: LPS export ABC transporter permease LptF [Burkholderiales bacterium]|nr:LPS export ABC transporter permease LptF [Burkholderiales bacterium]